MATLEEQQKYKEKLEKLLNPISKNDWNPDTFEPIDMPEADLTLRDRVMPPKILPTHGLKPKEIRDAQLIGMYESKQQLYLIFAHRCNELQAKVEELEARITELEKK